MINRFKPIPALCLLLFAGQAAWAQSPGGWSLRKCIDYARENNIQVHSTQVTQQSSQEDLAEAKAKRVPSLDFSTSQNYVNQKSEKTDGNFEANGTYSGNYALKTGITIYNGSKLTNSLRQQEVINKSRQFQVDMARNAIEIAVTQAYLNILYANENVKISRQTVESSAAQLERSKALLEAGSIAPSDYAQMESQYSSDKYQLTVSQTSLDQNILTLKQLLELGLDESFDVQFPDLSSEDVLAEVPALDRVYRRALEVMPQVENSRLNVESAQLGEKIAAGDGLPSLTASASIGTGNISGTNYSFYNQPFAISAFPFINITTSCFYGECRFLAAFQLFREFASSIHISLACCLITIYLNQNVGHHMMGRYHVAMLVQHIINKLSSGSFRECRSVVYLAVFSKHTVTQFIVDSIQSTAICIDLIANCLFCQ